jgi:hypothetical protein
LAICSKNGNSENEQEEDAMIPFRLCLGLWMMGLCLQTAVSAQPASVAQSESVPDCGVKLSPAARKTDRVPPPQLFLLEGNSLPVRLSDTLSSDRNKRGDGFTVIFDEPLVLQGWIVAQRGQTAIGRVEEARKSRNFFGRDSRLSITLTELVLADCTRIPIRTNSLRYTARRRPDMRALLPLAGAGVGAAMGTIAGGGKGAAAGAVAGAAAGAGAGHIASTRATELTSETWLDFFITDKVAIPTAPIRQALVPAE